MKRSLQLLLIAALVLGGWRQRGNYLSGRLQLALRSSHQRLHRRAGELATISSYPRQSVTSSKLIRDWCEPLRQGP